MGLEAQSPARRWPRGESHRQSSQISRLEIETGSEIQGAGRVVAIGEHSINPPVKIGDRVGLKWLASTCLRCEMCRKGSESSQSSSLSYFQHRLTL